MLAEVKDNLAHAKEAPTLDKLKNHFQRFLDLADKEVKKNPWLVAIAMHEYFRCLYPADPYIPFDENVSSSQRITGVLDSCIAMLESASSLGSYFTQQIITIDHVASERSTPSGRRPEEDETQQVYGRLWDDFDKDNYFEESVELLDARLKNSGVSRPDFKDKVVLDLGCGSGRFTMAMAMAGAKQAHGVDMGVKSLENARTIADKAGISNIEFKVGDALSLPYENDTFDFVWCNGVLHHTKDMEFGIKEMHRVLKTGSQAFLYLYGSGGLFWHSRKHMRPIMQQIPQEYTLACLDLIGMPHNRFIFADNWYVPLERHTTKTWLEDYLTEVGFISLQKVIGVRTTDLDYGLASDEPEAELIWGDGEHRYLITKA